MGSIQILEKRVAERIAAGEVVERPASVVKELLENSLDAGATQIVIEIEGAGSRLIRVSDNGSGMDGSDLRLCIRRFATSKIASLDDLETAATFGFRGEALPSIAAVSHLQIVTAVPGATEGRRLRLVGGEQPKQDTVGAPQGTAVTVRHLFFNTPARRKFLKSPTREFALIIDAVNRAALASPHVAFRLIHEDGEVLVYPAGRREDRAAAVLGSTPFDRMVPLRETTGDVTISGWLGTAELARAVRRHQYLLVNRRSVYSRTINAAVEQAYRQLIPAGRYPVFVVYVDLPGHRIDVNVHPRKLEIRFDDEHQIFTAVSNAARRALRTVPVAPAAAVPIPAGTPLALADFTAFSPAPEPVEVARAGRLPAMRLLGQLHGTYLVAQGDDGLILIDQHAAHERVLYERLLRTDARSAAGQILVDPLPVTLSADEAAVLQAHREIFEQIGFDLEAFGDRTVLIRKVPGIAANRSAEPLLRDLLAELTGSPQVAAPQTLLERLTITMACHTAVRAGDRLAPGQMAALLSDLAQTEDPLTCFHGRPTLVTIPLSSLERWFLRK